jgi:hypothetical protein
MKLEELITIARSAERIPEDVALELLNYGVTAFLSEGVAYNEIVDIIARAEISCNRALTQGVSFPRRKE